MKPKKHQIPTFNDQLASARPPVTAEGKREALEALEWLMDKIRNNCRMTDISSAESFEARVRDFISNVPSTK